jgi:hypothetical protein
MLIIYDEGAAVRLTAPLAPTEITSSAMQNVTYKSPGVSSQRPLGRFLSKSFDLLLVVVILGLSSPRQVSLFDEGVILTGAAQLQAGLVINRDFYSNYGPGQFSLLAMAHQILGESVLVGRVLDTLVKSGIVVLTFILARRISRPEIARGTAVIVVVWLGALAAPNYPAWTVLLLALVASYFISKSLEATDDAKVLAAPLVFAGVCIGLTILFRYDLGLACFAAVVVVLATEAGAVSIPHTSGHRRQSIKRALFYFGCGVAVPVLPAAAYFSAAGVWSDLLFQVGTQAEIYPRFRSLPFPLPGQAVDGGFAWASIVYFPTLALIGWASAVVRDRLSLRSSQWMRATLLCALLTIVFYAKGFIRTSPLHMGLPVITSLILTAGLVERGIRCLSRSTPRLPLVVFLLVALAVPSLVATAVTTQRAVETLLAIGSSSTRNCVQSSGNDRLACFEVPSDMRLALDFVRLRTKPGELLFVASGRHDKIFVNNVAFYFFSGLRPATKWYQFDPGLQTTQTIQELIANDLARERPRFLVRVSTWDDAAEPNESSTSSGIHLLDRFIDSHYRRVADYGDYAVLELIE